MTGFFGIGMGEVLLILVLAFLAFGPGKLPEIARGLGKAVRQFNKYSSDVTRDFRNEFEREFNAPAGTEKESTMKDKEILNESMADLTKAGGTRS
jgi:TatA/E family protein of Tat protein translocase